MDENLGAKDEGPCQRPAPCQGPVNHQTAGYLSETLKSHAREAVRHLTVPLNLPQLPRKRTPPCQDSALCQGPQFTACYGAGTPIGSHCRCLLVQDRCNYPGWAVAGPCQRSALCQGSG